MTFKSCEIHNNKALTVRLAFQTFCDIFPIAPMGSSADVSASTRAFVHWVVCGWRLISSASERSPFELSTTCSPLPPWEDHVLLVYLQGGVFIGGSSTKADFQNCNIYSNTASYVRACILNFPQPFPHRPHGKLAFMISSFLCRGVASWSMVAP